MLDTKMSSIHMIVVIKSHLIAPFVSRIMMDVIVVPMVQIHIARYVLYDIVVPINTRMLTVGITKVIPQ